MNDTEFKQFIKDKVIPDLFEFYECGIKGKCDIYSIYWFQVSTLLTVKEYEKAIEQAKLGIEHLKEFKVDTIENIRKGLAIKASFFSLIGTALYGLGKYKEALDYYNKSLDTSYENSVFYHKGLTLEKLGRYQEAQKCYTEVIDYNPIVLDAVKRKAICNSKISK